MSSGGSWESLRLEARKYEVHINQQLQELSQKADSLRHEEKRKSPTPMTTIHQDTATTSSHNNDRYRRKGGSSGYDEESGPLLGASGGEDQDEDTCTRLLHDTDASLHHVGALQCNLLLQGHVHEMLAGLLADGTFGTQIERTPRSRAVLYQWCIRAEDARSVPRLSPRVQQAIQRDTAPERITGVI
eukprot:gb/GECG01011974.1/.p1 GENE.gb/GECG01011974.1/~~gb/GECG01011974.1/.p1  ORF type:complete len:187 (+),score=22.21 gb/GECG01011974.1/:1-561(+)